MVFMSKRSIGVLGFGASFFASGGAGAGLAGVLSTS
jgi:hypothetical protein